MNKFLEYGAALYCLFSASAVFASEKYELLPDLPDTFSFASQPAGAATVTGGNALVGNVGHEPSIISVIFSLLFVVLLIYLTGILYAKLNKVGFQTLKRQQGDLAKSHVNIVSTTALGNNKTLHVVELDGKRMLIGASSGAIQLIKDLGSVSESSEETYSSIEIPNIKIPKIEIPKIEIPTVNFSKILAKAQSDAAVANEESDFKEGNQTEFYTQDDVKDDTTGNLEYTEVCKNKENQEIIKEDIKTRASEHVVDPEEFALYKKYLG